MASVRLTFEGATYQDVRRAVTEWLTDPDDAMATAVHNANANPSADPYADLPPAWTEDAPRAALQAQAPTGRTNPFAQPVGASTAAVADPEPAPHCPDHGVPMLFRPADRSKRTGRPYAAFWSCPERDCNRTQNYMART